MYYARVNGKNICIAVFGDNKKRNEPDLIELEDDIEVLGKQWNGEAWEGDTYKQPQPEALDMNTVLLETAVNVEYLVALKELEF